MVSPTGSDASPGPPSTVVESVCAGELNAPPTGAVAASRDSFPLVVEVQRAVTKPLGPIAVASSETESVASAMSCFEEKPPGVTKTASGLPVNTGPGIDSIRLGHATIPLPESLSATLTPSGLSSVGDTTVGDPKVPPGGRTAARTTCGSGAPSMNARSVSPVGAMATCGSLGLPTAKFCGAPKPAPGGAKETLIPEPVRHAHTASPVGATPSENSTALVVCPGMS